MAKQDYYESLGVDKNATDDEIKNAFRKAAKKYHPDLHPDDKASETKFKEINEAYEVLSDKEKRAKYDQFGHAAFDPSMGGGAGGGFSGFSDMGDIFDSFFGGGFGFGGGNARASKNAPRPGRDLRYSLNITFEEAAFGCEKEIGLSREENCSTCGGNGAKPGTTPETCSRCKGSGQIHVQQNTILGAFSTVQTCNVCNGTGKVIKEVCQDCRGNGRVRKTKRVKIRVPAGIDNGQAFRVPNEGEAGYNGGSYGDLQVVISVKPHKIFARNGFDIYMDMNIPFPVAALGGDIEVPTLKGGNIKYHVPAGTQPNTTFRLREQGITRLHSTSRGDLLVKINIVVPKNLSDDQEKIIRQLAESLGNDVSGKKRKGFFEKVKDNI